MKYPAKFSNEVKRIIFERDGGKCCLCGNGQWIMDIHHYLFWNSAERTNSKRNDSNKGLLLDRNCHNLVHACKRWQWARWMCEAYMEKYKENKTCFK